MLHPEHEKLTTVLHFLQNTDNKRQIIHFNKLLQIMDLIIIIIININIINIYRKCLIYYKMIFKIFHSTCTYKARLTSRLTLIIIYYSRFIII